MKILKKKQKGYVLLGLAILGFVLVNVAFITKKYLHTKLEITRIERRVLFLELDFLFQGVKKEIATLNVAQLASE